MAPPSPPPSPPQSVLDRDAGNRHEGSPAATVDDEPAADAGQHVKTRVVRHLPPPSMIVVRLLPRIDTLSLMSGPR